MHPGFDMGAPTGFASRRPNASSLPTFELPRPSAPGHAQYQYANPHPASHKGYVTSFGNLLTTLSNVSGACISPAPTPTTSASTTTGVPPAYNGYLWSPSSHNSPYGFQSAGANQQHFTPQRAGPFGSFIQHPSPIRVDRVTNLTLGLPPPQYEGNLPLFQSSGPMSAPMTMSSHPHHSMPMTATTRVSSVPPHPSPVHAQDGFHPLPTPAFYSQANSTPHQPTFSYSSGPSSVQQSPLSVTSSMHRLSPASTGPVPSMPPTAQSPHAYQRPFGQYPLPGPVLSNAPNPHGQMQLMPAPLGHSLSIGFHSDHATHMNGVYRGPLSQPHPQTVPIERPFKCDVCPQSFNRNHDLKRHKRIHLAIKPFPCDCCDKAFSRKDALKRHKLVKGCGKAPSAAAAEAEAAVDEGTDNDESSSQVDQSDVKPIVL